jgi:ribonuclease III
MAGLYPLEPGLHVGEVVGAAPDRPRAQLHGRPTPVALAGTLGHRFADPDLLALALTHPSAAGDNGGDEARLRNYQRLEFLGDRVLGLAIAELLIHRFPEEREGRLARRHTQLVRKETLARVARAIDLGSHLVLSRGEEEAGGRLNPAILADCCEAVIAALFLDGGMPAAERFIHEHWAPIMEAAATPPKDVKTALQEWTQARSLPLPDYKVVANEGPDHRPVFSVEVSVAGQPSVVATGTSKRSAEKAAARKLLDAIEAGGA